MKVELDLHKDAVPTKGGLVLPIGGSLKEYAEFARRYLACSAVVVQFCRTIPTSLDTKACDYDPEALPANFVAACAKDPDLDSVGMVAEPCKLADPVAAMKLGYEFYAGVPLYLDTGERLGMLCAVDTDPREITGDQLAMLKMLGGIIVQTMTFRIAVASDPTGRNAVNDQA